MVQAVGNVQAVKNNYNAPQKMENHFWKKYWKDSAIATGIGGAIGAGAGAIFGNMWVNEISPEALKELPKSARIFKNSLLGLLCWGGIGACTVAFGSVVLAGIVGIVKLCKEVPKNE